MYCTNCGNQLPDWARFCNYCGGPLPARFADGAAPPIPEFQPDLSSAPDQEAGFAPPPLPISYFEQPTQPVLPQAPPQPPPPEVRELFPDLESEPDPAGALAVGAFVLGLFSILCFFVGAMPGIPAVLLGMIELLKIRAGRSPAAGRSLALLGVFLGITGTVFFCLIAIFFIGDPFIK